MVAPALLAAIPAIASALGSMGQSSEGGGQGGMMMPPQYQAPNMLGAVSPLESQNAQMQVGKRNKFKNSMINNFGGMQ